MSSIHDNAGLHMRDLVLTVTFFLSTILCLNFAQATPLTLPTFKKYRELFGVQTAAKSRIRDFINIRKINLSKKPEVVELLRAQSRKIEDVDFSAVVDQIEEDHSMMMYLQHKKLTTEENILELIKLHKSSVVQTMLKIFRSQEISQAQRRFDSAVTAVTDREMLKVLDQGTIKKNAF